MGPAQQAIRPTGTANGRLPAKEVLEKLDPYLVQVRERYGNAPQPAVVKAGNLCPEWAKRLGLSTDVVISGSSFDAHAGRWGPASGRRP